MATLAGGHVLMARHEHLTPMPDSTHDRFGRLFFEEQHLDSSDLDTEDTLLPQAFRG